MKAINSDGIKFLGELGRRITQITDDNLTSANVSANSHNPEDDF